MDLYKYMCLILLTMVCYIDAGFILTKNDYTWLEATQVCTLATSHLTFSESGITPDLDNLPSADAWLGYIENMTSFEYFGCAKKSDLKLNTADYTTEGDPGKCWSACNNGNNVEAIAVNGNECYCLQTVNADGNTLKKDNCDKGCPGQPNIVCGHGNDYVSLYKTTYTEPIQGSYPESYLCLLYVRATISFQWGNCTDYNLIICYNDDSVWVYEGHNKYRDWITNTKKCFNKHGIPSNHNNTKDVITRENANMWTGIIRNDVIYPVTNPTHALVGKYGFVRNGMLSFTNSATMTKRALCVEGTTTEDTTDENKTDVGAIVGATLAIIVVIVLVIVLVVLWKRGMKFPFKKSRKLERKTTQATNMTYNFTRPDNTIQGTAESSFNDYAEVDVSKMTPVTGVTQNGDANRTSDSLDEPYPYIVFEKGNEGTFDTTKTTPQIHDQHTFNPYNEISLDESSNYDHIDAHVNDAKTLGLDNPYNTTTLTSLNKYNGFENNASNRNDDSDDTYNHIDGQ